MRRRIRPAYTDEELAQIYAVPHNADMWEEHQIRIEESIDFIRKNLPGPPLSVADLSCGNAAIARSYAQTSKYMYLGDYAPGYEFTGPVEQTIDQIPHVKLFILSETLEHLDDPDMVLAKIRGKADRLFLSTPYKEDHDNNPEHYWAWDMDGVEQMLSRAGWTWSACELLKLDYYTYQLWMAY